MTVAAARRLRFPYYLRRVFAFSWLPTLDLARYANAMQKPLFSASVFSVLLLTFGCHTPKPTVKAPPVEKRASSEVANRSTSVPELRALHVSDGAIKVDGKLDDQGWTQAASTGPFVRSPDGKPNPSSPVNAEAKIAWDDDHLYFAFQVHDKNPTSPFSPADEDPHVWEYSSAVELMIQPGDPGNNERYYEIQVDTAGAVWDTRFDDYNKPITGGPAPETKRYGHQSWKSGLDKAIVIDGEAGHYTVELAIPFS